MTQTTEPLPQHLQALKRGNDVRLARSALKRRVACGELSVADVILDCPSEAASMTIFELLRSQRRWGDLRCRRFLTGIGMLERKTVGSLTERQRLLLAGMLR